jgi:hypothetical protein
MNLTPDLLIRDLKVALRSLAHTKGLAIAVVLTLALGIGAMLRSSAWCGACCCGRSSIATRTG